MGKNVLEKREKIDAHHACAEKGLCMLLKYLVKSNLVRNGKCVVAACYLVEVTQLLMCGGFAAKSQLVVASNT